MRHATTLITVLVLLFTSLLPAGASAEEAARPDDPDSTAFTLPDGYSLEAVARELTYPTSIAFGEAGEIYVTEAGYAYGPAKAIPRVLRFSPDGGREVVVDQGFEGPLTGIAYKDDFLYVADGANPGKLVQVDAKTGETEILVDGLPTGGDHFTGDVAVGPDGAIYFGAGTATNSAVAGLDNFI